MRNAARSLDDERVAYQLGIRHFESGEDEAALSQLTRSWRRVPASQTSIICSASSRATRRSRRGDAALRNSGHAEPGLSRSAPRARERVRATRRLDRSEAIVFSTPVTDRTAGSPHPGEAGDLQAALATPTGKPARSARRLRLPQGARPLPGSRTSAIDWASRCASTDCRTRRSGSSGAYCAQAGHLDASVQLGLTFWVARPGGRAGYPMAGVIDAELPAPMRSST